MMIKQDTRNKIIYQSFWGEIGSIFLFYLKIFLTTIVVGSVIFFLYSGFRTGIIPSFLSTVSSSPIFSLIIILTLFPFFAFKVYQRLKNKKSTKSIKPTKSSNILEVSSANAGKISTILYSTREKSSNKEKNNTLEYISMKLDTIEYLIIRGTLLILLLTTLLSFVVEKLVKLFTR